MPNRVPDLLAYLSPKNPEKNVVDILVIRPAKLTLPYVVEFRLSDCFIFGNKVTFRAETYICLIVCPNKINEASIHLPLLVEDWGFEFFKG